MYIILKGAWFYTKRDVMFIILKGTYVLYLNRPDVCHHKRGPYVYHFKMGIMHIILNGSCMLY